MTPEAILALVQLALQLEPVVLPMVKGLVEHAQDAVAGAVVTEADVEATLSQYGTNMAALQAAIAKA
jgi:hypothetical protein